MFETGFRCTVSLRAKREHDPSKNKRLPANVPMLRRCLLRDEIVKPKTRVISVPSGEGSRQDFRYPRDRFHYHSSRVQIIFNLGGKPIRYLIFPPTRVSVIAYFYRREGDKEERRRADNAFATTRLAGVQTQLEEMQRKANREIASRHLSSPRGS